MSVIRYIALLVLAIILGCLSWLGMYFIGNFLIVIGKASGQFICSTLGILPFRFFNLCPSLNDKQDLIRALYENGVIYGLAAYTSSLVAVKVAPGKSKKIVALLFCIFFVSYLLMSTSLYFFDIPELKEHYWSAIIRYFVETVAAIIAYKYLFKQPIVTVEQP